MANNETTTSFKADISELKKAMQEARRQVAIANSEFEESASTMEDWSRSSDGITAKLRQLDTTLNSQRTILANYERQLERTREEYPEGGRAVDELIVQINRQRAAINRTEREIEQYRQSLDEVSDAEREASRSGRSVAEVLDDVGDSAGDAGDGFTTFKGAIAAFAGNMITGFVNAIGEGISAIVNLADETREYRTELGKLETAFTTAGFSGETATETYKDFYAVLGDEGQAVEAVNHLSKLAETEEDLAKWTDIATGVYGTFGASLPIEGLTEASNETAKTGQVTGALADALNWSAKEGETFGVALKANTKANEEYNKKVKEAASAEDYFNIALSECSTEQERQTLITETLNGLYKDASDTYKEVNGDIMDAQRAQSELTDATANLGAVAEPVMTSVKLLGASLLNELLPSVSELGAGFTDLMNGVEGADQRIGESIGGLVDTILGKITELLPTVLSVGLSLVTSLISGILNALPNLVTTIVTMAGTILDALSMALPQIALTIVDVVPKIIDALMTMLPVFITACIDFLSAIVQAIPSVVQAILKAIPQLITSIVNGLVSGSTALLQGALQLFMALTDAIPQIINILIQELPVIIETILTTVLTALPQLLEAVITLIMALVDAIPQVITPLLSAIVEAIPTLILAVMNALFEAMPLLYKTAFDLFMMLVKPVPTNITVELIKAVGILIWKVLEAIGDLLIGLVKIYAKVYTLLGKWAWELIKKGADIGKKFVTTVINWLKDIVPKAWEWLVKVVTKVIEWRANMIAKAKETAMSFINNIITYVSQLPSKIWTWLVSVVTKVLQWRANLIAKAKEVAKSLVETLIDKVKELPDKIKSIGTDIVKGLWNGINDMTSWIKDKIKGFGDSVLGGLKDFFGINSPSKLMADEVGKFLPEGIAVGIDKSAKSVMQSMRDVTMGAVSGARAGLVTGGSVVAGGTVGAGSVVNNFYQTNNSPKALSRLEIYRQSKNLLGLAGGV